MDCTFGVHGRKLWKNGVFVNVGHSWGNLTVNILPKLPSYKALNYTPRRKYTNSMYQDTHIFQAIKLGSTLFSPSFLQMHWYTMKSSKIVSK